MKLTWSWFEYRRSSAVLVLPLAVAAELSLPCVADLLSPFIWDLYLCQCYQSNQAARNVGNCAPCPCSLYLNSVVRTYYEFVLHCTNWTLNPELILIYFLVAMSNSMNLCEQQRCKWKLVGRFSERWTNELKRCDISFLWTKVFIIKPQNLQLWGL